MYILRRSHHFGFVFAAGAVPLLLALTLTAPPDARSAPVPGPSQSPSPLQVADILDSIVQPRFQKNAGRFGADRVVELDGHGNIHWTEADTRAERRGFAAVQASRRPYIIAFLHCRHKPGAHIDPSTKPEPFSRDFRPFTTALVTVGATQTGAQRMYEWANKALDPMVLPRGKPLTQGQPAQADYENWVVVMRPVRAEHPACLNCHAGAQRGDTLGVMVYAVDKNAKIKGKSFHWSDSGA